MLSRRAGAFEYAASDEAVKREAQIERARALLDEQAAGLMASDPADVPAETPAQHAPYDPHRRPLSSAARRLIRAHEYVEQTAQD